MLWHFGGANYIWKSITNPFPLDSVRNWCLIQFVKTVGPKNWSSFGLKWGGLGQQDWKSRTLASDVESESLFYHFCVTAGKWTSLGLSFYFCKTDNISCHPELLWEWEHQQDQLLSCLLHTYLLVMYSAVSVIWNMARSQKRSFKRSKL